MRKRRILLTIFFLVILCSPIAARSLTADTAAYPKKDKGRARGEAVKPVATKQADKKKPPIRKPETAVRRGKRTTTASEILLVNKKRALPADYVPADLRAAEVPFACDESSPKRQLRGEAAAAVERLFAQAEAERIELVGVSGYRSYARQEAIFAAHVERDGAEAANLVSARPGESEHQTGLAIDVSSPSVGGELSETLAETEAGRWLARNASKYGFIIRYPKGKEDVTGYQYEPWHLRYVGADHAPAMAEQGLTLEEYMDAED